MVAQAEGLGCCFKSLLLSWRLIGVGTVIVIPVKTLKYNHSMQAQLLRVFLVNKWVAYISLGQASSEDFGQVTLPLCLFAVYHINSNFIKLLA